MKAFLIGGKYNKLKGTKSLSLCFVKVQSAEVKAVPITTDQESTPGCQPTFPGLKSMWLRIAASMCSRNDVAIVDKLTADLHNFIINKLIGL